MIIILSSLPPPAGALLGPDLLCRFSGSLWFLFCRWQSDSCKPFDDAVNPDAGPWLHLPCHSHPLQSLFLVFKVFWRSLVAWRILTNAAADSAAFARYQCGLFIWWVFKVNPRQWIPLLCFVPGPEHPILSAWFSVGFAWLDNFWVCWCFLLFFVGFPLLRSFLWFFIISGLLTSPFRWPE